MHYGCLLLRRHAGCGLVCDEARQGYRRVHEAGDIVGSKSLLPAPHILSPQRKKHTKKATTKEAATEEVVRDPTAVEGASSGAGGGAGAGAGAGAAAMPNTAT